MTQQRATFDTANVIEYNKESEFHQIPDCRRMDFLQRINEQEKWILENYVSDFKGSGIPFAVTKTDENYKREGIVRQRPVYTLWKEDVAIHKPTTNV